MEPVNNEFFRAQVVEGGVLVIILDLEGNPLNNICVALSRPMEEILNNAAADEQVRAIVITAEGPVFSTGAFLPDLVRESTLGALHLARKGIRIWGMFETIPKVTCAAINGLCLGGGLELALCCDFRIASKRARFGQTEINLGLIPGWGGTQRLCRLVGRPTALEMVLTGQQIRADRALEIGLVHRVVPHSDLLEEALAFVRPIAAKSLETVALAKAALQFPMELGHRAGLEAEAIFFSQSWSLESTKRTVHDFLEREGRGRDDAG